MARSSSRRRARLSLTRQTAQIGDVRISPAWAGWMFLEATNGRASLIAQDIGSRVDVKTSLDVLLLRLQQMPQWRMPLSKRLGEGECKGLVELRYEVRNVEYRPLGYFAENWRFVLLMMAREINNAWVPSDACKTAKARKRVVEGRTDRIRPYAFG